MGVRDGCADHVVLFVEARQEDSPLLEALGIVLHKQPITCTHGVVADVDAEVFQRRQ